MARQRPQPGLMVLSLLGSVLLHVVVALVWGWMAEREEGFATALDLDALEMEDPRQPRLGIQQSKAVTMTWIGFAEPTEHEAPKSVTEQPSLAIGEPGGAAPSPDTPPAPAKAQPEPRPEVVNPWTARLRNVDFSVESAQAEELLRRILEGARIAAEAQAETAGGETATKGPAGTQDQPDAQQSDREVDAVARRRPVKVQPGKPAAAEGLEIKTTRPNWTLLMRSSARPSNPVVEITFGPDGRARLVEFAKRDGKVQSTGWRDVNDVLVNAMYRWTATGEAIDELDEKDPEAGVMITLEIILR